MNTLDYKYKGEVYKPSVEIAFGKDSVASETPSPFFGIIKDHYYLAFNTEHSLNFLFKNDVLKKLEPFLNISYILYDIESPHKQSLQFIPGFNIAFGKKQYVRWMNGYEITYVDQPLYKNMKKVNNHITSKIQLSW